MKSRSSSSKVGATRPRKPSADVPHWGFLFASSVAVLGLSVSLFATANENRASANDRLDKPHQDYVVSRRPGRDLDRPPVSVYYGYAGAVGEQYVVTPGANTYSHSLSQDPELSVIVPGRSEPIRPICVVGCSRD